MKVLFFLHYSDLYGANRSFLNLLDGLGSRVKCTIVLPEKGKIEQELRNRNVAYEIINYEWSTYHREFRSEIKKPLRILRRFINTLFVTYQIKKYKPDIIHTNSSVTAIGFFASLILGIPHIWHVREFGVDDYNLHYDFGESGKKYLLKKSNEIIAISHAIDNYLGKKKAKIIYNGLFWKSEMIQRKDGPNTGKEILNFGIIGYISPNKGQEEAINSIANISKKIPDVHLYIIGTGDETYLTYLKNVVEKFDLGKHVTFTGFISNVETIYSMIDAVLVCSRREGMGRIIPEAMIRYVPVVGRCSGAIPELISHGKTGLLYNTTQELEKAMLLLNTSPEHAHNICVSAFQYALNKFSIEDYSNAVFNLYNKVLKI